MSRILAYMYIGIYIPTTWHMYMYVCIYLPEPLGPTRRPILKFGGRNWRSSAGSLKETDPSNEKSKSSVTFCVKSSCFTVYVSTRQHTSAYVSIRQHT